MRYTEFIINSDITLKLRLTLESMVMLERRFGESPLAIIARMGSSDQSWNRLDVIPILNYAIVGEHTLDNVYDIMDIYLEDHTDIELASVLVQLIKDSGFLGEENKDENNSKVEQPADNIDKEEEPTLEESLKDLLEKCMERGIEEELFWSSTYGEINRKIKSIQAMELNRSRERAAFDHKLADLIGISVARLLSKEAEYPSVEEVYPSLFEMDEEEKAQREADRQAAIIKARLMEYASWHNNKMAKQKAENKTNTE